jgi:hypothetical protein
MKRTALLVFLASISWLLFISLTFGLLYYTNGSETGKEFFKTYGYKWYSLLAVFGIIVYTYFYREEKKKKH